MQRFPVCPECGEVPTETCPHGSALCPHCGTRVEAPCSCSHECDRCRKAYR